MGTPVSIIALIPLAVATQVSQWSRPYVADARLFLQKTGQRHGELFFPWHKVELEAGEEVTLTVEPLDQWGRTFPEGLAGFVFEDDHACRGVVTLESVTPTRFRLQAGVERGRCSARLVAVGNLNLEWTLAIKDGSVAHGGYTRAQVEYIAMRLYRALLLREPDPEGFRAAGAEIQRNRLGFLLEGMLTSPEFKEKWRGKPPTEFLEKAYLGILGRSPDSAGVHRYLREVERGRLTGVVADIIHPEEFEHAVLMAAGRG